MTSLDDLNKLNPSATKLNARIYQYLDLVWSDNPVIKEFVPNNILIILKAQ